MNGKKRNARRLFIGGETRRKDKDVGGWSLLSWILER
jgi:hypothetical protein